MCHNILWTSGWDSTFRVLDVVLNKKGKIQPYYIIDKERKSTKLELATMEKIKQMIIEKDPSARNRIKPITKINIESIPPNEEITLNYKSLTNISHLGGQYDWLARFAESEGIIDLELSVHIDDTVHGFIKDDVIKLDNDDVRYVLKEELSNKSLEIFKRFSFPLLQLTKLEMEIKSREYGFSDIMEETWFCHSPIENEPCGMCNPCKYTREEGLGRRVPNPSIKNRILRFTSKLKRKLLN